MAKKDLIGLAKSGTATAKKTTKKPVAAVKKPVFKAPTPEEVRDLKAKAKVEELLQDSPIVTLDKKEELLELDEVTKDEPKGVEWLEEQVTLLSEKNEALSSELTLTKNDYQKLLNDFQQVRSGGGSNDGEIQRGVLQLFNELQENHIKLGVNQEGIGNFRIYCPGFLNRLIKFFPFLEEHKRY